MPPTSWFERFQRLLPSVEGRVPQQTAPANRVPIAQQESYKMAQAIFEVLEGRNILLITTLLQLE